MRSPEVRSNAIEYVGGMPMVLFTRTALTLHTAVSAVIGVIPFDYEVVLAGINVTEAPGTAPGSVYCGKSTDTDGIIDDLDIELADPTGYRTVSIATAGQYGSIGDIIVAGSDGDATTTGLAHVVIVVVPRNA